MLRDCVAASEARYPRHTATVPFGDIRHLGSIPPKDHGS